MNTHLSHSASHASSPSMLRAPRYFAATYFTGDDILQDGRQRLFRSSRWGRAHGIASMNRPSGADRWTLEEISREEFERRREAVSWNAHSGAR